MTHNFRRALAAQYLKEKHGFPCSAGTLANYATQGSGPRFKLSGRWPIYNSADLDDWAESRISEPRRMTSEARAA